ncbi:MAG TPA: PhzF family phenazine biosynthesis protein [Thermoanaerobaculia bacterium]|nr:PhzF family phenazine biosynthesis protein [Thermoanaerobaculia bacterium]
MRFFIVDVFAEQKYAGNPLAVFVLDRELPATDMQQITREIHFSESTFIKPGVREGGFDVRIFTPDREVPFAGHPTLGTAFVIRSLLKWQPGNRIVLNLGVGPIAVDVDGDVLTMQQNQPRFDAPIADRARVASILGINFDDLDERLPVQVVSTGLPFVIVPLRTRRAVAQCAIQHALYRRFLNEVVQASLLVFAAETEDAKNDLHARVFVDDTGFFEDPATGSANGNLAAYVVEHGVFGKSDVGYRVEQGCEMGRPSLLRIQASKRGGEFSIRVGGRVFPVADGEWLHESMRATTASA